MKKLLFSLVLLSVCIDTKAQNDLNLDFETLKDANTSVGWSSFGNGDYQITYDTKIVKNGKVSGAIESTGDNIEFKALSYNIPANFGGKKIKLTGYLKTENVENGWAGLWMRIDPQIAFDNMRSRKIDGTNDWKKYEIELKLNNRAQQIVFGGLLSGSGKIWVDDLEITVDGKPLNQAPEKALDKVQSDKEFDKGSNISFGTLDAKQIENLELLGRVWGFLKYYHPEIGKGNYNWDYELFRILPKYQKVSSNSERDNLLLNWINGLGKVEPCKKCKPTSEDAFLKPDLEWMTTGNMSEALTEKLQYIQNNRHQGEHYYIGVIPNVGNPEFKNENPYADMTYPDAGFRLLSLYRYWNMINYFFPNRHLMDKDWDTCLAEYIPKFLKAKNELEYEIAAIKIIADIKDTHANLWGGNDKVQEQRGTFVPDAHVKFVENKLVVDAYFNEDNTSSSGLKRGDIITHISEKSVDDLVKDLHDMYPASNQPTRLRDMSFDLLRSTNNTLNVTILRDGKTLNTTLDLFNRDEISGYYRWYKSEKDKPSFKMLDNNIGYVTLKNISQLDVPELRKEFKDTKGIVVDIRNYPSAFMPFSLGSFFVSKYSTFVKFTNANLNNPGEFNYGKDLSIPPKGRFYKGKVVVLVNETSQSQAEYTAMAFRAGDNVTIIGSTTAGADGNVSTIYLPGGMRTMISGIGVHYPDGTETQRVGIVPDIEVKPTIDGIRDGRDEVLEKAMEIINQTITTNETIKD
ncbi:S41 family peptidase [uncultured Psychroserpens sp.]|uniref:S41 family peptidase n=1 Tax=uncultured Psychroserpens sp. TaxID=255436 RepID=UPI0026273F6C|nr:S41 family peptidase [uncultured Psychroserpens sp.]